ncbi:MAG: 50S ribosomal protein L37ae [Candidatus Pacearchaeota archaeon]
MATKRLKSAGRFGVRYGLRVKSRVIQIEEKQRKKQVCSFCKKPSAKRIASSGIWKCKKCGKKFASNVYYLE